MWLDRELLEMAGLYNDVRGLWFRLMEMLRVRWPILFTDENVERVLKVYRVMKDSEIETERSMFRLSSSSQSSSNISLYDPSSRQSSDNAC